MTFRARLAVKGRPDLSRTTRPFKFRLLAELMFNVWEPIWRPLPLGSYRLEVQKRQGGKWVDA